MGKPTILAIRYDRKKTEVFVSWGDYLGSKAYVTMRIGKEKAETSEWSMSSDKTATFYPKDRVSLIKRIALVDKVVFQCTPYNESPITAIFDVRGLSELAEKYMGDLRWW
jgi:type VI secretion system protein VasI